MSTPKIIHFLWLDFINKTDGEINPNLEFFVNRIRTLHPDYEINFIHIWEKCMKSITIEFEWIKPLLKNSNLGGAHKSDILRFYYLYTQGGVWVDISTFFVVSINDLVEENKDGFTCFYVPHKVCQTWIYNPLAMLYDLLPVDNILGLSKYVHSNIADKYKTFTFIPESYFCISNARNPICYTILQNYKTFHDNADIKSSKENFINSRNEYTHNLCCNIFDNETGILNPIIEQLKNVYTTKKKKGEFLNKMYDGGYLFIYLMMFVAIAEYSLEKNMTPKKIDNVIRTKVLSTAKSDIKNICDADACFDIILSNNADSTIAKIHLLSASYNRLGKWSNNLSQRMSWNDTLAGNIIDNAKNEGDLLRDLTKIDIKQLKFGSWTRDSPIIPKLRALFPGTSKDQDNGRRRGTFGSLTQKYRRIFPETSKVQDKGTRRGTFGSLTQKYRRIFPETSKDPHKGGRRGIVIKINKKRKSKHRTKRNSNLTKRRRRSKKYSKIKI